MPKKKSSTATRRAVSTGPRPLVGISACLLGRNVRHDGRNALARTIVETLGPHVEWVPLCPESDSGLGVPRPAMQLRGRPVSPRLVIVNTGVDVSLRVTAWLCGHLDELAASGVRGFILKSRSPSCGLSGVPVLGPDGAAANSGPGILARALKSRFPNLPIAEETDLADRRSCTQFLKRLTAK